MNTRIETVWRTFDRTLLTAVFLLLAWHLSGFRDNAPAPSSGDIAKNATPYSHTEPETTPLIAPPVEVARQRAVDPFRVSSTRTPVRRLARSFSDDWERVSCSQAMDIRGDGRHCEVAISVPHGITSDDIKIRAADNLLNIEMPDAPGGVLRRRRIFLPCEPNKTLSVSSLLTNGVLRVRVNVKE
ncbi:MAG: Hsp20/alpha crystallin family protein [Kiritimatiellae bacterium]|nr:Hsp20/alpha crystallin family protein [Kiritimatiellia bacterium]